MQEYKKGGKITLDDNSEYRILEIIKEDDKEYLFCCTTKKPIIPMLFEKVIEDGEVYVAEEDDKEIVQRIANQMIKKYGDML